MGVVLGAGNTVYSRSELQVATSVCRKGGKEDPPLPRKEHEWKENAFSEKYGKIVHTEENFILWKRSECVAVVVSIF